MKNKMIFTFLIISVVLMGCGSLDEFPPTPYVKMSNRYTGGCIRMPLDRIVTDNLTHVVIIIPKREDGFKIDYKYSVK